MTHNDHVRLIEKGVGEGGVWADLGSGSGAFTLALRDIAGPSVEIFSVDKDAGSLQVQQRAFETRFPGSFIHYIVQDFTMMSGLPSLDGILMANSLHFIDNKLPVLRHLKNLLRPQGKLVIVEYNVDHGNVWVPYPFSFETWKEIARDAGYVGATLLETIPSSFLREIYSSACSLSQ